MSTNGKIKVKCITGNKYGLIVGEYYSAFTIQSPMRNRDSIISVINAYGEEYAYPADLFEIVND